MYRTIFTYTKSFIQALLIFIIIVFAIDRIRRPVQPTTFVGHSLTTLSQNRIALTGLSQNQTAILYFWGSWCSVCRYTSPAVEKLHQEGIPVLSIAIKSGSGPMLQTYLKKHNLTFPTVNDSDGLIADYWQVSVTPTIILIKNGRMRHATTGISSYWGLRSRLFLSNLTD